MYTTHSNWYSYMYMFCNKFMAPTTNLSVYTQTNHFFYTHIPTIPTLSLVRDYILYAGDSFLMIPVTLMSALVIAFILHWFILGSNFNIFLTSLFSFSEKEVNALDDLLVCLFLIFLFFFFNFFCCFSFLFNCSYSLGFVCLFLTLICMLVSIPFSMAYNFGFYFIISIRGGATTLSYTYELILDYVNFISFTLRLCIQLVRIIVIGVTYYMYNHLFLVYNYLITPSISYNSTSQFELTSYLTMWARLVFEVGHTFVIFGIQLTAFSVMILWLFQFLFTLFFGETLEVSFIGRNTSN